MQVLRIASNQECYSGFPTTVWPTVIAASQPDSDGTAGALETVLKTYHGALRLHLSRKFGMDEHEAADCLQDFIHQKVMNGLLAKADQSRGRFRTFLLTALDRFAVSVHRRQTTQRRAPQSMVPLDEASEVEQLMATEPPVLEFDLAWARALMEETVALMKADCEKRGLSAVWGVFEQRLLLPLLDGVPPAAYGDLVARFQLESPTQAFNALITGKRLFARHLRAAVRQYALSDRDADAEICELRAILERA
jgi:RNA polymerase sigma-70 factor (ECF subfamily)